MCRLQAEEEAKQQALTLSEQLSELHQKHEVEVRSTLFMKKHLHRHLALSFTLASFLINGVGQDTAEVSVSRILNITFLYLSLGAMKS